MSKNHGDLDLLVTVTKSDISSDFDVYVRIWSVTITILYSQPVLPLADHGPPNPTLPRP